jgi:hypothetical protein
MTTTTAPGTTADRRRRPPRGRGRRFLVAGIVAALVAGGSLAVVGVLELRHRDAAAAAGLADALSSLETAGAELAAAVADGRDALAESDGRVADEDLRGALAGTLDAADLDLAVAPGTRAERTAHATRLADEAAGHTLRVRDAAGAVRADLVAWLLARAVEAHGAVLARLGAAAEAGTELLAGTEGQVAPDDASREALRAALDAAVAAQGAVVDRSDVAAVTRATEELTARADALDAAVAGVTGAHDAWSVAEAERAAAERAEADAARRPARGRSSAGPASAPAAGASPDSPRNGSPGGGSAPGASGGPGGGSWVDEGDVPGPDLCIWVDQSSSTGTC